MYIIVLDRNSRHNLRFKPAKLSSAGLSVSFETSLLSKFADVQVPFPLHPAHQYHQTLILRHLGTQVHCRSQIPHCYFHCQAIDDHNLRRSQCRCFHGGSSNTLPTILWRPSSVPAAKFALHRLHLPLLRHRRAPRSNLSG